MKPYLLLLLVIAGITGVLYFSHDYLVENHAIPLWRIYAFLSIATFITVAVLRWMQWYMADKVHLAFIALISVKLGLALILFPELLTNEPALTRSEILAFLAPYFVYLFLEILLVAKWLNKN